MGCWNKTCGISNLHITAGTKVYVFPLVQQTHRNRCYTTAFWKPMLMPFVSEYDDYGGGENSDSTLDKVLAQLREMVKKVEQGPNEYHDIPIDPAVLDEEMFFNGVHEGRLTLHEDMGGGAVDFTMMRKDVVDDIVENLVLEHYVGDGKGTTGYGNNYIKYKFADVVNHIPALIDMLVKSISESETLASLKERLQANGLIAQYIARTTDIPYSRDNLASGYIPRSADYNYVDSGLKEEMIRLLMSGDRDGAIAVAEKIVFANFIDSFMSLTRRNWMPMGHEGSQAQDHEGYRALIAAMTRVLDEESKDWGED